MWLFLAFFKVLSGNHKLLPEASPTFCSLKHRAAIEPSANNRIRPIWFSNLEVERFNFPDLFTLLSRNEL